MVDANDCRGGPGEACWDLNGNGTGDPATEDLNGDTVVDLNDCRGPDGPPPIDLTGVNLTAVHDASSRRYDDDCLKCHREVLTRRTLDSTIPDAHLAMLPEIPTFSAATGVDNEDCAYCHPTVDLGPNRSAGNIRRQVAVGRCSMCHADGPAVSDFYLP